MTASLARNGKGKAAMSGALLTTFPASGIARDIHPGLVALPGSGAVLESPDRAGLSPRLYPADGQPGGRVVERVGSGATADFIARENLSLSLRHEPGSQALREGSESAPCVRLHAHSMEKTNAERVASAYVKERG